MGSGVSIVPAVGGDFVEEEDEECWLVTMGSGVSVVPAVGAGHENGVGIGSRVDIGASVGGDFVEEEDGKCWLVTGEKYAPQEKGGAVPLESIDSYYKRGNERFRIRQEAMCNTYPLLLGVVGLELERKQKQKMESIRLIYSICPSRHSSFLLSYQSPFLCKPSLSLKLRKQFPLTSQNVLEAASLLRPSATLSSDSYSQTIELADIEWDNLGFGLQPTDYMYIMKCTRGGTFSKVSTCTESTQALNLVPERKDCIDLILIEVHMPTMNGYEFLHRASKEIDVPVIVMSLDHNNYTVMRAVQLGACDFWVKPLRYYQFKNMRTHVLRKSLKENKIQTKDCVGSLEDDE
ncbi:hypothetical protein JHK85_018496 [Glycine max]|nr:hypothetical protein JHK85_018496 [Glycine max]